MLSIVIITKNEAHNIKKCLDSVQWADEIVVIDSGSTDDTVEIARQYTPLVFTMDWQGYGIQKQRALEKTSGGWVLNLDADESVNETLKRAIQQAIRDDKADAYRIPIQMVFYEQCLKYSCRPTRHIRLFKREGARYSLDIVHEKIVLPVNYKIGQLNEPIWHRSFLDMSHALYKLNRYSSYSAKIKLETHGPSSFTKTLLGTFWMFLRCYILQRGFLDGKAGFVMACYNAQGTFYRGVKQLYKDSSHRHLPDVEAGES